MKVTSRAKFIRVSPKKTQLVVKAIRGEKATVADEKLRFIQKKSAGIIQKVLKAAMADAKNNYNLSAEELTVTRATVDSGPTFKRFEPRARGMANPIIKRTSHITIVLEDLPEAVKTKEKSAAKSSAKVKPGDKPKTSANENMETAAPKEESK